MGLPEHYWNHELPKFTDPAKLINAMQAYTRDLAARGQVLPPTVTLRELLAGGYIATNDVRAFEGMEVTISTAPDPTDPQAPLIRVRLPDGTMNVFMGDGSVQGFRQWPHGTK